MIIFKNAAAMRIEHIRLAHCCRFDRLIRIMRKRIIQMKTFACWFTCRRRKIIERIFSVLRWTSINNFSLKGKNETKRNEKLNKKENQRTDRSIPMLDHVVVDF